MQHLLGSGRRKVWSYIAGSILIFCDIIYVFTFIILIFISKNLLTLIKRDLKKSFKRVSQIKPRSRTKENIRRFMESAWLIKTLIQKEYEVVFADEFTLKTRQTKLKTWTDKGKHGFINGADQNFRMSFALAFSKMRFYCIENTKGTFNSDGFIEFIKNIKKQYDNDPIVNHAQLVIVIYNAPIHVSCVVKEFWDSERLFVVTMWPYSPSLNPWEKAIAAIKAKTKKLESIEK